MKMLPLGKDFPSVEKVQYIFVEVTTVNSHHKGTVHVRTLLSIYLTTKTPKYSKSKPSSWNLSYKATSCKQLVTNILGWHAVLEFSIVFNLF